MRHVHVEETTPRQRRYLRGTATELYKIDINRATPAEIAAYSDVPIELAAAIHEHRPYFSLFDVSAVEGCDAQAFARISEIFCAPELHYHDKSLDRRTELRQDPSMLIVQAEEVEGASATASPTDALRTTAPTRPVRHEWLRLAAAETETGTRQLRALRRRSAGRTVMPSFWAGRERRFLDPRYCAVQFDRGVPPTEIRQILADLGLASHKTLRSRGLLIVAIAGGERDPARVFEAIAGLNDRREVRFAEPCYLGFDDFDIHPRSALRTGAVELEAAAMPWNLALLDLAEAHAHGRGSAEVLVAIIDSGIDADHPAIAGAVVPHPDGADWNFESDADGSLRDDLGHGTFVAGIVAGNGRMGVYGVSPGIKLLPLKIPTTASIESYARRRDAILYAVDYARGRYPLVINLSWRTGGDIALIRDAIDQARAAGALVVASAGNWAATPEEPHYPSDYESVVAVGAVGRDGGVVEYSMLGAAVDLVAPGGSGSVVPGENLLSAVPDDAVTTDFGTSFAAPHVAGVAALVWSQNPQLTAVGVRTILEDSARVVQTGSGPLKLLNAAAAVAYTRAALGTVPAGSPATGLSDINTRTADELAARYGLLALTARLIVLRRPYSAVAQIEGTLGLTAAQFASICAAGETRPAAAPAQPPDTGVTTIPVNAASFLELAGVPGMPTITARLIIARRPFSAMEQVLSIIGMTPSVAQRLSL